MENDMKTNHRHSGTMCATCTHANKDCSALEFSTMRAIKKDADGTTVVRCSAQAKAKNEPHESALADAMRLLKRCEIFVRAIDEKNGRNILKDIEIVINGK